MLGNIPLPARQRACANLSCEDETEYILDIYSCVQPERHGRNESRKQIFLFITRAEENNRSEFLQEQNIKLGMINVHSYKFCWRRTEDADTLVAKLQIEDCDAVRMIKRQKIDEMRWPEKATYTLPSCDASAMKIVAKLFSGRLSGETLLETEELNVKLAMIPDCETKPAAEHDCTANYPREHSVVTEQPIFT